MRILRLILFLITICFFDHLLYAQSGAVAAMLASRKKHQNPIQYQIQEGYIILKDGRALTGRFKYDHWEFPVKNFAFYKDAKSKPTRVKFKNIKKAVFIGADTNIVFRKDSTEFVGIKKRLYRKLADGQIKIYDKIIRVQDWQGKIGKYLYVESKGKLKRISSLHQLNKWYQGLATQYANLRIRNDYLNKIEIIKEIQKYNALSN